MEPAIRGLVLDSSVLVAAERSKQTIHDVIDSLQAAVGDLPIVLCALTVAELAHGIYRADTPQRSRQRRQFLDELKAHVPVRPVTAVTAEIIGRIGGELAAKGIQVPLADLMIGACAVEVGYAVATRNARDFGRIAGLVVVQA